MGELIIAWIIVGVAGIFLLRRLARAIAGRDATGGCAGCDGTGCGGMQPPAGEKPACGCRGMDNGTPPENTTAR